MRRRTTAVALAMAAAAAWTETARRDATRVANDPRGAELEHPSPTRTMTVRAADGADLYVEEHGPDGAPTVVLVHGWLCSLRLWAPQVRALATDHRIVLFDQRGHGRSGPGRADRFHSDSLADDLSAVVDATVPAGQRAVVVGHSMGAMGMVAWAGRHPDQVRERAAAALLINTGVSRLVADSSLIPPLTRWPRLVTVAGNLFQTYPLPLGPATPLTSRGLRYIALSRSATPAQVAFCERMFLSCPRQVRIGWGDMMNRMDLEPAVSQLDVPTVVVYGTADRLTPPVHSERLAVTLPRLDRVVELAGVGHMSTVEAASAVTSEIRRAVAAHARQQPVRVGA